jgi:hypothetical protein
MRRPISISKALGSKKQHQSLLDDYRLHKDAPAKLKSKAGIAQDGAELSLLASIPKIT